MFALFLTQKGLADEFRFGWEADSMPKVTEMLILHYDLGLNSGVNERWRSASCPRFP